METVIILGLIITGVAITLIKYIIRNKFSNKDKLHVLIEKPEREIVPNNNKKHVYYIYFIVSLSALVFTTYFSFKIFSLYLNHITVNGILDRIDCQDISEDDLCSPIYRVYFVSYTYKGTESQVISASSGVRSRTPSPLYSNNVKVGENVEVWIDKIDSSNVMIANDLRVTLLLFTSTLVIIVLGILLHSIYLIRKRE